MAAPAASPAADAVARLLPDAERTVFLAEREASTVDLAERRALGLLLAEGAEADVQQLVHGRILPAGRGAGKA